MLQQRIDSWQYEVDQLLFGTILFTLIVFLLPTITAYYLLFALVSVRCFSHRPTDRLQMQAPISLSVLLMNKTITLMNQLALFGPILWIKDPWRMPCMLIGYCMLHAIADLRPFCTGGVYLTIETQKGSDTILTVQVQLIFKHGVGPFLKS